MLDALGEFPELAFIERAAGVGGGFVDGVDGEVLKATTHHPNAGEDQTAEANDSAGIDGERLH